METNDGFWFGVIILIIIFFWAIGSLKVKKAKEYNSFSNNPSEKKDDTHDEYWTKARLEELLQKRTKDPKRYGTV